MKSLISSNYLCNEKGIASILADQPNKVLNSDVNLRLEFDAPRRMFRRKPSGIDSRLTGFVKADWVKQCFESLECGPGQLNVLRDRIYGLTENSEKEQLAEYYIGIAKKGDENDAAHGELLKILFSPGITKEEIKTCLLYTSPSPRDRG